MATVTWDVWYDDVVPHVGGCPVNVVKMKIREAAIDFCKRSRTWRFLGMTAIDSVAAQQTYVPAVAGVGGLPAGTVLAHVYQANWIGARLDVLTPKAFIAQSDTWFSDAGDPTAVTMFNEGELSLFKIPAAAVVGALKLPEVALAPRQDATGIDSTIFEKYRTAIAMGAKSLIHMLPREPYTDMKLGEYELTQFNAAIGSADARAASGRGQARLRTQTLHRG